MCYINISSIPQHNICLFHQEVFKTKKKKDFFHLRRKMALFFLVEGTHKRLKYSSS